jgi:hypothetical protein
MRIELKSLNDLVELAEAVGVKVIKHVPFPAIAQFVSFDEMYVGYDPTVSGSEWKALIRASVQLDGWAHFRALYIDHDNKVVDVEL